MLEYSKGSVPEGMRISTFFDQSLYVRASIQGVIREAIIAACLTAAMILLFLGNWKSTVIIAVSIPLSILVSILCLSALGQTINIMTLGGLALAVGILVDDATVEIENINRNLAMGKETVQAILDGAQQIAVPAFVSTLCICIVFIPMFFLSGVAKFLFIPLAEAVSFAMLASYMWSRTIVPTLAMYLLSSEDEYHPRNTSAKRWASSGAINKDLSAVLKSFAKATAEPWAPLCAPRGFSPCASSPSVFCPCCSSAFWGVTSFRRLTPTDSPAHARSYRSAHRGNGASRRPGQRCHSRHHPQRRADHGPRQYRLALQRHQPHL